MTRSRPAKETTQSCMV